MRDPLVLRVRLLTSWAPEIDGVCAHGRDQTALRQKSVRLGETGPPGVEERSGT